MRLDKILFLGGCALPPTASFIWIPPVTRKLICVSIAITEPAVTYFCSRLTSVCFLGIHVINVWVECNWTGTLTSVGVTIKLSLTHAIVMTSTSQEIKEDVKQRETEAVSCFFDLNGVSLNVSKFTWRSFPVCHIT